MTWRTPIDAVLVAEFLGYGAALIALGRRGPDGFAAARIEEAILAAGVCRKPAPSAAAGSASIMMSSAARARRRRLRRPRAGPGRRGGGRW